MRVSRPALGAPLLLYRYRSTDTETAPNLNPGFPTAMRTALQIALALVALQSVAAFQLAASTRPIASHQRSSFIAAAQDDDNDAPIPMFSFLPDDTDETAAPKPAPPPPAPSPPPPPKPPAFSFFSAPKEEKKKNAVDIENEKRAKFLQQQQEFKQRRKDYSVQDDLCAALPIQLVCRLDFTDSMSCHTSVAGRNSRSALPPVTSAMPWSAPRFRRSRCPLALSQSSASSIWWWACFPEAA